jgi:hypothetical protein
MLRVIGDYRPGIELNLGYVHAMQKVSNTATTRPPQEFTIRIKVFSQ